jgi:hypothetical protein
MPDTETEVEFTSKSNLPWEEDLLPQIESHSNSKVD